MMASAVRCLVMVAALGAAWPVLAQAPPGECRAPAGDGHPLAGRGETLASYEQMPEGCLKAMFKACSDVAGQTLLDLGSAAQCSFAYEALLKRGFGGNFHALIGWWRREREQTATH